ncbi:MAG: 3-oxoacyl-ACP synthase [Flavobacteriaceae bacterium]
MMAVKDQLQQECKQFLNSRLLAITDRIASIQDSLQSETKSSAGDKHETGRAMLQLEREKAGNQLKALQNQQMLLSKVDCNVQSDVVCLGSLVTTNIAKYFIAISVGKIAIDGHIYLAISPSSPIGRLLLGKSVDDEFVFNGVKQQIIEIR